MAHMFSAARKKKGGDFLPRGRKKLVWNAKRQNRVDAQTLKFCASAHGDSRFFELLTLLVV